MQAPSISLHEEPSRCHCVLVLDLAPCWNIQNTTNPRKVQHGIEGSVPVSDMYKQPALEDVYTLCAHKSLLAETSSRNVLSCVWREDEWVIWKSHPAGHLWVQSGNHEECGGTRTGTASCALYVVDCGETWHAWFGEDHQSSVPDSASAIFQIMLKLFRQKSWLQTQTKFLK